MNPRLRAGYHTWHELITNSTVADAIRDRLIHNAHRITLKGESMRKTKNRLT
jgi:DNA replication protein DnaC